MAQPQVGSHIAGYRIESLIGRGGMGVVYRATQLDLGRTVALKVIAPEALADAAARDRFVSEARNAAAIEHPNVLPIHTAGESDGVAYFAMRFVEGDDLRARVRRGGPLPPAHAAAITESVGAALDAIHHAGLVHRDVKPANILLAAGDHVYLTDFGLARAALHAGTTTGSGHWAGSLHYAAPEQIRGGRVDARADVYALGGVLVFMLTGHVPFERDSDEATLWAHVAEPPPRPSHLHRGLPKALDDVVARAMAKDPGDRYASAGDLGRAASAAAHGRRAPRLQGTVAQGAASPSGALPVPGLSDEAPTLTATALSRRPAAPGRRRQRAGLVAGGLAVVAVATVILATRGGSHPAPPVTPTASPTSTATATPTATPRGARVAATFPGVSDHPNEIARVGHQLWVTSASRPLIRLDALTGRHRASDPRLGPGGKALAVQGNVVWVANRTTRQIVAVAAASPHRVLTRLPLASSEIPVDVAPDPDGGVWAAVRQPSQTGPAELLRYDSAQRLLQRIPVANGISDIVVTPKGVWVAEFTAGLLLRINRRTGRAHVGAHLNVPAGALAYGGGCVWASMTSHDAVARICPHQGPIYSQAGQDPRQLTYVRGRVYVASRFDQALVVIDPQKMKPVKRLAMPFNPFAVTSDSRHVWVTSLGEGSVTRVDVE